MNGGGQVGWIGGEGEGRARIKRGRMWWSRKMRICRWKVEHTMYLLQTEEDGVEWESR